MGSKNAGDSVGYIKVVAEELDPEAMPLMAPYVWARNRVKKLIKELP